jgi:hypothetical protein
MQNYMHQLSATENQFYYLAAPLSPSPRHPAALVIWWLACGNQISVSLFIISINVLYTLLQKNYSHMNSSFSFSKMVN